MIHVTLQNGVKCPINMYDVHFESLVRGTVELFFGTQVSWGTDWVPI